MMRSAPAKIRLKDVADAANVSLATASMALAKHPSIHPQTCELIRRVSNELGYRRPRDRMDEAARRFAATGIRHFGFLLLKRSFGDPAYSSMLSGLNASLVSRRLRAQIFAIEHPEHEDDMIRQAVDFARQLDGLAMAGIMSRRLVAAMADTGTPTVILGRPVEEDGNVASYTPPLPCIYHDEQRMARLAMDLLVRQGHRRIAFLCREAIPGSTHAKWLEGYQLAHLAYGLTLDPQLIFTEGSIDTAPTEGKKAARLFAAMSDPPTAFIIPSLNMVQCFLQSMASHGITVPTENVILSGIETLVQLRDLTDYPRIVGDGDILMDGAVRMIEQMHTGQMTVNCHLVVPFVCRSLPDTTI